jgi:hypothetical protein
MTSNNETTRRKLVEMPQDIRKVKDFFEQDPKTTGNKSKNRQLLLHQDKKLLRVKETMIGVKR